MPHNILILGGGPAGLSTALHLARLAPELTPRILVLEKAHYPRHKLCAGALTADAEIILQRLGLDVREVPHVDAAEAHLDFAGSGLVLALRKAHALRMIRRDEFDAWLAAKARTAGIEIREGVTAHLVDPRPDSVLVDTDAGDFEAAVVVGADGSNGITRRCILPNSKIHTARALEVLVPQPDRAERSAAQSKGAEEHSADAAYFDFAPVPLGIAGYTWDFPTQVDGKPMRCWGIYDTNLLANQTRSPLKQPLADEMQRQGTALEEVELQGHPIRWFSSHSALSVPRVVLVGDAAGVDGIFGEGISIALGYGRIAADAIHDAVKRGDFSFADYRRRIFRSPLGRALAVRTAITHVLYGLHWAWFQKLFWRLLKPVVAAVAFVLVLNWAKRMR
jgi:flavin-dependent dehydrogenase